MAPSWFDEITQGAARRPNPGEIRFVDPPPPPATGIDRMGEIIDAQRYLGALKTAKADNQMRATIDAALAQDEPSYEPYDRARRDFMRSRNNPKIPRTYQPPSTPPWEEIARQRWYLPEFRMRLSDLVPDGRTRMLPEEFTAREQSAFNKGGYEAIQPRMSEALVPGAAGRMATAETKVLPPSQNQPKWFAPGAETKVTPFPMGGDLGVVAEGKGPLANWAVPKDLSAVDMPASEITNTKPPAFPRALSAGDAPPPMPRGSSAAWYDPASYAKTEVAPRPSAGSTAMGLAGKIAGPLGIAGAIPDLIDIYRTGGTFPGSGESPRPAWLETALDLGDAAKMGAIGLGVAPMAAAAMKNPAVLFPSLLGVAGVAGSEAIGQRIADRNVADAEARGRNAFSGTLPSGRSVVNTAAMPEGPIAVPRLPPDLPPEETGRNAFSGWTPRGMVGMPPSRKPMWRPPSP